MFNWKRIFLSVSIFILIVFGVFLYYSYFIEPNELIVKNYQINLSQWNKNLNGFKIVLISDIHGGSNSIDEAKIRRVVELSNEQNADLILLLGDYVSQQRFDRTKLKMPIETVAENLKGLKAKFGVYAVLGNHDGWFDDDKTKNELEKIGYKVLENQVVSLDVNGQKIRLLGMADALKVGNWQSYIEKAKDAISKVEREGNLIVFTHNPEVFPILNEVDADLSNEISLMIAGHTHGGQCKFPIIGSPIIPTSYGQRYVSGEVIENGKHFFISSGIGTSILPIRYNVPPEISVLVINNPD
jgi:predicted MPP superfamily phosphohydrolase